MSIDQCSYPDEEEGISYGEASPEKKEKE
ncbi:hypothetical protein A2U01_0071071, partial [Trifolium medium]|nr:hypothetical protein [Trifolium medium]